MKLRKEKKITENEINLDPNGVYEIGGFGVLIEEHPHKRHIVKHCTTGELLDKRQAYAVGQHKGNYFYLKIGETINANDLEQLIPSRFDELKGD